MDHSKSIYLLQGLFFQDVVTYGIGQKPGIGEAVYQTKNLHHVLFSGVIAPDPQDVKGPLFGALQDQFGVSNLTEVTFSDEKLEFIKQYDRKFDEIKYSFKKKDGNLLIGTWEVASGHTGFAKCLVTAVDEKFFDPFPGAKLLGITLR
jgi:hypothetical protein